MDSVTIFLPQFFHWSTFVSRTKLWANTRVKVRSRSAGGGGGGKNIRFSLQIFTVSWVLQSSGAATCSQHISEPFGPICSQQTVTCSLQATVSEWRRIPHTRPNLNLSFQYRLARASRQDFHFYSWQDHFIVFS